MGAVGSPAVTHHSYPKLVFSTGDALSALSTQVAAEQGMPGAWHSERDPRRGPPLRQDAGTGRAAGLARRAQGRRRCDRAGVLRRARRRAAERDEARALARA